MGYLKRKAKQVAVSAGERFMERHVIGERRPMRSLRGAQPHERLDALRPDVPWFQAWVIRPGILIAAGFGAWIVQSIAASSIGWGFVIAMVVAALLFHRTVFRWWLIAQDEPYTHNFLYPTKKLFSGAFRVLGSSRIALIALAVAAVFDLFNQLAGSSPSSLFAVVANLFFVVALGALTYSALKLGRTYSKRIDERYELLWALKVIRFEDIPGELVHGLPIQRAVLHESFGPTELLPLQEDAEARGYTITDYRIAGRFRTAELTPVSSIEMKAYHDAARNLRQHVYDFTFLFEWVDNDEADRDVYPQRIETLIIKRGPIAGLTPDKREAFLLALRDSLPKGSNGWKITDRQDDPVKVLQYGKPLALPDVVALEQSLPQDPGISGWARVPVGKNSAGTFIGMNLKRVPHLLIAGGTNSGKSTLLRADMLGRLARGHDIVVIDTVKGANDFLTVKPWTLMWGETIPEAANILAHVYEESVRRRAFLKKYKRGNWADLTPEQCEEGGIRPLSIFYDEYENSIVPKTVQKALGADHPLVLAAHAHNMGVGYINEYMPQLAKEARSVGIHLVVATQTPHSGRIGEALRGNLGGAIQLSAGKLEQHIVRLTMGEATGQAMDQFNTFNKPKLDEHGREVLDEEGNVIMLPGLGVVLMDGGAPTAMRVGYASEPRVVELLNELGVAEVEPWRLDDALQLDMVRTEDEDETRTPIKPPFARMSHLLGNESVIPVEQHGADPSASDDTKASRSIFDPEVWEN
ncbi:MAG: FtsK/SpoIIIE domain-containing protein [Microbacterium sp.]|uniref:type IV secretory system conjugative DNA transfer family protein n=1 Tax=Microbacterium sp. TaxID=51671 RepID=UPI003D6F2A6E